MSAEWLKDLQPADLPDPYNEIAAKVGVETVLILAQEFGGMMHYFPKLDRSLRKVRDKKIKEEFNGLNQRQLARKYDLTVSQIRVILKVKTL